MFSGIVFGFCFVLAALGLIFGGAGLMMWLDVNKGGFVVGATIGIATLAVAAAVAGAIICARA